MPKEDSEKVGHAYPFNACEILCTDNGLNLDKIIEAQDDEPEKENDSEESNPLNKEDELENLNKLNEENEEKAQTEQKKETTQDDKQEEPKEDTAPKEEKEEQAKEEQPKEEATKEESTKEEPKEEEKPKEENLNENVKKEEGNEKEGEGKHEEEEGKVDSEKDKKAEGNEEDTVQQKSSNKPNMENTYAIFDHLFSFLDEEPSDDNYVLMGYFNKIVTYLLNVGAKTVLTYLFTVKPVIIQKLFKHIGRKAIGSIIENIISFLNDETIPESSTHLIKITQGLIDAFAADQKDTYELEAACDVLINSMIVSKKSNFILFVSNQKILDSLVTLMEKLVKEKQNCKILYISKVLIKFCETFLKEFTKKVTQNYSSNEAENEIVNIISSLTRGIQGIRDQSKTNDNDGANQTLTQSQYDIVLTFLNSMLNIIITDLVENESTETITILLENQPRMGMKALYEWEFIRNILEVVVNCVSNNLSEEIVAKISGDISKSKLFEHLVKSYFKYTMNNMFQNFFIQIIEVGLFAETPSELVEALLLTNAEKGQTLIEQLMKDIIENHRFIFKSKKEMNSCLFSNDIHALQTIFASKNKRVSNLFSNSGKEKFFCEKFVPLVEEQFQKKLLYEQSGDNKIEDFTNPLYDTPPAEPIKPSLETVNEVISFGLEVYDSYINNQDYEAVIRKHEEKLKEREQEKKKEFNEINDQDEKQERMSDDRENLFASPDDRSSGFLEGNDQPEEEVEEKKEEKKEGDFMDNNYWSTPIGVKESDVLSELGM